MNWAHIHLLLNHVPFFGALAGTIVLGISVAQKRLGVARAGFMVIVLTALVAGAVFLTGEPAEELVEDLPGVSEAVMEWHEEVALISLIVLAAFALVALYGLVRFRHGISLRYARAAFLLSLLPLAAMAYTAYSGGQIRHSEVRPPTLSESGKAGARQSATLSRSRNAEPR